MIAIGDKTRIARRFSEEDVATYVALGGAAPERGVIPEPMIAALFSYLLGVELPGPGTNYLKQSLTFHRYVKVGHELNATVEVTRLRPDKALADLETICTDETGELICSGRALVRIKDIA